MNRSAESLLERAAGALINSPIEAALPEFGHAFKSARENVLGHYEDQIDFDTPVGQKRFDLRVSGYQDGGDHTGWVITFDDMTRLVAAQRQSAWRDVARRIAHEIKNPLTPILLSTERLRRKYKDEIESEPEVFENCTNTIIRQVGSLENMVNEFSTFARMPTPEFEDIDLTEIIDSVLFSQGVAFPDIRFEFKNSTPDTSWISCDQRLLAQALTNLYKNAGESVSQRQDQSGDENLTGIITTNLSVEDQDLIIDIEDNGLGWPVPDAERLLEPYVTTRQSGTGLGLAIVSRIIEDHGGSIHLSERADDIPGARVSVILPLHTSGQAIKPSSQVNTGVIHET